MPFHTPAKSIRHSLLILGFLGVNLTYASAMDCAGYVGLPLVEPTLRTLGLNQAVTHGHISSDDFFAKTLISLTRAFVDQKTRLVTLRYLIGFTGSNPVYNELLIYKHNIGDDWDKKGIGQLFPQGATASEMAFPSIEDQLQSATPVTEVVRLYCFEQN